MSKVTPYLFFTDNCREALKFYQSCLGGELEIMTYGDAQGDACSLASRDKVMHGCLKKGGMLLMASDDPVAPPVPGTNVQLALNCESLVEIESTFAALSHGGKADYPLHDAFWGACFGTLTDRYGVRWLLNFEKKK